AALVLIAALMVCFMIMLTLSVDVAMLHLARTQLRTSTDAAAKAAAVTFADTGRQRLAIAKGRELARENTIFNEPLVLSRSDFQFGRSEQLNSGRFAFTPRPGLGNANAQAGAMNTNAQAGPINTIRVVGERTATSRSGGIPSLFGKTLGLNPFETRIESTATLVRRDIALMMDGAVDARAYNAQLAAVAAFTNAARNGPTPVQIGVGSYTNVGTVHQGVTNNFGLVGNFLTNILQALFGGLFTPPGGAGGDASVGLVTGKQMLDALVVRDDTERSIVLISTASGTFGPDPRIRARAIAAEGIVIHTVSFGRNADRAMMREVAQIGRGLHFHARNQAQLVAAHREIARSVKPLMVE
ncbi:MAG: pilus assembly protein TadG-related protein, partial [Planctomycetaceae bacterium]